MGLTCFRMWIFGAVCVLLCMTSTDPVSAGLLSPCQTESHESSLMTLYYMDGQPLKTITFVTQITGDDNGECQMNTAEMVANMSLDKTVFYVAVCLCKQQQKIHLTNYSGPFYGQPIFQVQIMNCILDIHSLKTLINIADTKVLITKTNFDMAENILNESFLSSIVTFSWEGVFETEHRLSSILHETYVYPALAEIILRNITIDINWTDMKNMLPNLKSLELPNCNLVVPPPLFPWTDTLVKLPRNLSRSPYMNNHYSDSEFIKVKANIFRHIFNLANNRIKDLRKFSFHGVLQKISLAKNGLFAFNNDTFANVKELQNLDLSQNKLSSLPSGAFENLTELRKLDLSGNKLMNIPPNIFDNLMNLQELDLANNSLVSLPKRIFQLLTNLEHLRLEHNHLIELFSTSFPLQSINLKELHFEYNPLTKLPHFPFETRGLKVASFRGTNITLNNLTQFLKDAEYAKIELSVIDTASNDDISDLLQGPDTLRKIDLTDCNISRIELVEIEKLSAFERAVLILLLKHFEFVLTGNPLRCDCRNNNFIKFVHTYRENETSPRYEYSNNEMICQTPKELHNKKLLDIKPIQTYCEVAINNCPGECACYKREVVNTTIVDCRDKNLSRMHTRQPEGKLELWYSGNNLTTVVKLASSESIVSIDLSSNSIERIDENFFQTMTNLKVLRLQDNYLAYLPKTLETLSLLEAEISPNPFTCDCNSIWMKHWLLTHRSIITNWEKVTCKVENEEGMAIFNTPDEKFICDFETPFDELRYVIMPSVLSSSFVIIIAICAFLIYTYRLECKVLLFVYFGLHPFDTDSENLDEKIDCVIVHSDKQTDWVMEQIVSLLESDNYSFTVCDMARDFVVGYSFQENLTRTVRHSKRMIFCVSQDWNYSVDSFKMAWRIAQEKIKDKKSHYGVVVAHGINANEVGDEDMKRFIKQGRYVNSAEKFFKDKIIYYMPSKQQFSENVHFTPQQSNSEYITNCFKSSLPCCSTDLVGKTDVFANLRGVHVYISYHDDDLHYVLFKLVPLLESRGYTCCLADRDFVPGASTEENVLNAINGCDRTLFVMSKAHIVDEWSLFGFRTAYAKSLREKTNNLLVVIKENMNNDIEDEEMRYYVNNYVCLNETDRWFEQKLVNSFPELNKTDDEKVSTFKRKSTDLVVDSIALKIKGDDTDEMK